MDLPSLITNRDKLRQRLDNQPDTPAKVIISGLLSLPNQEVASAAVDTYCQQRWGVRPLGTATRLPSSLVTFGSSEDLFYAVSDILKRSLG